MSNTKNGGGSLAGSETRREPAQITPASDSNATLSNVKEPFAYCVGVLYGGRFSKVFTSTNIIETFQSTTNLHLCRPTYSLLLPRLRSVANGAV